MKQILSLFLLVLAMSACAQKTKTITVTVQPYQSLQNYEHFKRLVLVSDNSRIEFIEGFNFEWGYEYKLKVAETELKETLSDGTRYRHKLEEIVSKTRVSDTLQFDLILDANRYYHKIDESDGLINTTFEHINKSCFLYFDKIEIEVPAAFKNKFKAVLNGERRSKGRFVFVGDKRIRLIGL